MVTARVGEVPRTPLSVESPWPNTARVAEVPRTPDYIRQAPKRVHATDIEDAESSHEWCRSEYAISHEDADRNANGNTVLLIIKNALTSK